MNYTIPDKELPSDVYSRDDNATNILTYMQNTNKSLAYPVLPSSANVQQNTLKTGGQSLNNMEDR